MTDDGLAFLCSLELKGGLSLISCPVTDDGVTELKQLKSSTELWLVGTNITEAGLKELEEALPHCSIFYDSDGNYTAEQVNEFIAERDAKLSSASAH